MVLARSAKSKSASSTPVRRSFRPHCPLSCASMTRPANCSAQLSPLANDWAALALKWHRIARESSFTPARPAATKRSRFRRIPPFTIDPGINVVEHPMKHTQVNALDHPHIVQLHVQPVLLHLFELAAAIAR